MAKVYAVYSKSMQNDDVDWLMSNLYPTPAEYGDFYLFAQPHPSPSSTIVDLCGTGTDELIVAVTAKVALGFGVYVDESQGAAIAEAYSTAIDLEAV